MIEFEGYKIPKCTLIEEEVRETFKGNACRIKSCSYTLECKICLFAISVTENNTPGKKEAFRRYIDSRWSDENQKIAIHCETENVGIKPLIPPEMATNIKEEDMNSSIKKVFGDSYTSNTTEAINKYFGDMPNSHFTVMWMEDNKEAIRDRALALQKEDEAKENNK